LFPAIIFENIYMPNIAFKYTAEGAIGLRLAKKLLFITTRGGIYTTKK
jgi:FMN-dependent NADH-azoreductase